MDFQSILTALLLNPDYLVLLLLAGVLLVYAEFNMPGTVVPGALGLLCILLSLFGLSRMRVSHAAVALLLIGITVMLLELKAPSHGILGLAGTALLVWGLATLVIAPDPVHLATALAAGIAFGGITLTLAFIALRARGNKLLLGPQAMLGKLAIARTPLQPSGQVEIRGELWQATLAPGEAASFAPPGAALVVGAVEGLHLTVSPAHSEE